MIEKTHLSRPSRKITFRYPYILTVKIVQQQSKGKLYFRSPPPPPDFINDQITFSNIMNSVLPFSSQKKKHSLSPKQMHGPKTPRPPPTSPQSLES